MSVGQVPYTVVVKYGDRMGLHYDTTEFLWEVLHQVDLRYLELMRDKTSSS